MSDIEQADRPDRFSVEHRVVGGVRVVTVRGEIDHDVKSVLGDALLRADGATPPSRIVVDLSGVTFMDSSGINVFVAAHQAVSAGEGWLRIAAAQDPVLQVLRLVGIDTLIPCHPTLEQALGT
ncbi:anti-anti-sigma factor [Streptomyces sp. 3330]|uniref:STAS domain-containing protein n=1 Tax=Streptomyces sp. 3330 TaxID=2817755 RepID=UPI00285765A2|nr:STAS domain-containing protein [Streptomyces sp. 3330]MDR6978356.1 anti-anti-sigma factor [Streptomyces sp. 3330]